MTHRDGRDMGADERLPMLYVPSREGPMSRWSFEARAARLAAMKDPGPAERLQSLGALAAAGGVGLTLVVALMVLDKDRYELPSRLLVGAALGGPIFLAGVIAFVAGVVLDAIRRPLLD